MSKIHFRQLADLLFEVKAGFRREKVCFDDAITMVIKLIRKAKQKRNKIIIVGNGGSAAIASHIATDLLKNLNIPSLVFNDPSMLTCIANDLGYENVFAKPIEVMGTKGDILLAISSSGKSANIINAVKMAKNKRMFVITLSGFLPTNPLRKIGDINFYVPSFSYGNVEIVHKAICHRIIDLLYENTTSR